jgi:hypothetical protein
MHATGPNGWCYRVESRSGWSAEGLLHLVCWPDKKNNIQVHSATSYLIFQYLQYWYNQYCPYCKSLLKCCRPRYRRTHLTHQVVLEKNAKDDLKPCTERQSSSCPVIWTSSCGEKDSAGHSKTASTTSKDTSPNSIQCSHQSTFSITGPFQGHQYY